MDSVLASSDLDFTGYLLLLSQLCWFPGWFYTTGSYPPGLKGWQRHIRLTANHPPRAAPYLSIAWYAYSEQEGTNRQAGGNAGDTNFLYALINRISKFFNSDLVSSESAYSRNTDGGYSRDSLWSATAGPKALSTRRCTACSICWKPTCPIEWRAMNTKS